jgi:endonuclease YncB( thermonuclease family)
MGFTRRARDIGTAVAILAFTALIVARVGGEGGETITGAARAADGDTLTLDGHRIRLAGMDTPEMMQVCKRDGADWRCGVAARSRLAELLRSGSVTCRTQGRDKYDRWLARCEAGGGDLGARMVREGLAVAYGDYEDEERFARAERKGLWGTEFDMPQQWRRMNGRPQEDAHDAEPGVLGGILGTLGLK